MFFFIYFTGDTMSNFVVDLIMNYGYFGMFMGMVLEAVIIIIPSELILATGGILASKGLFTFTGAFITGLLGSVFCAIVIYFMGYFGGITFVKKYGKYFFMKEDEIEKSDSWFNKYGMISALVCRNIPIVRTLAFTYFGYVLGDNWIKINTYISYLKTPIRIIILFIVIKIVYNLYKKRKNKKNMI